MPKAVIFDVDGTLIDSNDLHTECWLEAFRHFGLHFTFDQVRGQIGKGGDQLLPALLPPQTFQQQGEAISEFRNDLFKRNYLAQVRPFPGVKALFERIHGDGAVIVLASSGLKVEVDQHVEMLGIGALISSATTADDAQSSKPSPDIFEAALKRLPADARNDVWVVGDTPYDAQAAGKAGLRTIGLMCGGFPEAVLRDAGCLAIFESPEHLLANYDTSPLAKLAPAYA
ncbi:HAD family hydrolase [Devosia sp. 1566]|uniref:HAD family hydrolase n=1 Tax=Devosia sp. 1566 TaxID=2499144 RepID=UPI000FDB300B|nr:HAD family hydrolase [Devosia sp. 1566]